MFYQISLTPIQKKFYEACHAGIISLDSMKQVSSFGEWLLGCRLDLACRFDEMLAEWHQNPTRILRLIEHSIRGLNEIHEAGRFHGDLRATSGFELIMMALKRFWLRMALDYWQNIDSSERLTVGQVYGSREGNW